MKVWIGKYRDHWYSPYTWFDYLFWWTDWSKCARYKGIWSLEDQARYVERPEWCERWADRLAPISQGIQWVLDRIHPRIEYVRVDRWDTWSMDSTLATIVLPMLRQLKATQHGAPNVDDEDVPEHLRSAAAEPKENEWDTDSNHFDRWAWVLNEMIYAFEMKNRDDWTQEFHTGEIDLKWVPVDKDGNEVAKGEHKFYRMDRGPNDTSQWDMEGQQRVQARISNGFRLFGKYYEALWD